MAELTDDVTADSEYLETDTEGPTPGTWWELDDEAVLVRGAVNRVPVVGDIGNIPAGASFKVWAVKRGQAGTTAASHSSGATLTRYYPDAPGGEGGGLPTGGSAGQVLVKQSGTDGDADWEAPAGGAGGGAVSAEVTFAETAGAGTYTGEVEVPAGAIVTNVYAICEAGPWDADTADLAGGDTAHPTGYFNAVDLVGKLNTAYNPLDVGGVSAAQWMDGPLAHAESGSADYPSGSSVGIVTSASSVAFPTPGVRYAAGDTLTFTVTTTGAGGTTGRLRVRVEMLPPVAATAAVKS